MIERHAYIYLHVNLSYCYHAKGFASSANSPSHALPLHRRRLAVDGNLT